ncbi:MlaD family protein [Mycolicibacterium brumae]|uniref:MCE family protein n=1 Tax=Mycolicibacterium brumae TaxID=85968 RepID=A0A2G5PD61_9MYCO|nr:MlaD family protein [Mycolicibacterium brumae]MCV7193110.1 MCE family protein [Mycolicibacterium brumae]PIB75963.1 MCE family protein [Mycolicibacterium brumae]RWA16547.1 hypothetical protein MBRU_07425 [Mycolicibacterium brumae DSM 44177]UWW09766.1 MlaD family protein [Mycolicibacterium brumae]
MTTLLRVSEKRQDRIFTAIGAGFVAVVGVAALVYTIVLSPSGKPAKDTIAVAIETPFVGQGVADGTAVIMHGVEVGQVTQVSRVDGDRVRLDVELESAPTKGLTDGVGIDFRPANYFGVTGVNLIPADHGSPLDNGSLINVQTAGNLTLQTLLYRLGELTQNVVTPQLVSVMDRATRYTDALNPMFETMIQVSTAVADVQTVPTEQLLRNATAITVSLPSAMDAVLTLGHSYIWNASGVHFDPEQARAENPYLKYYDKLKLDYYNEASDTLATDPDKFIFGRFRAWFEGARLDLFSKMGDLEGSHTYDLFPLLDNVRVMADVVPRLVEPEDLGDKLGELRSRLERMYAGSGDQRALQVRIMLDQLPGVAAPMGIMLGEPQ